MKRALITGGSGFLGSFIADRLTEKAYDVRIFDLVPSPYLQPDQQMVLGSVGDREALTAATEGCSLVFHLAALADLNEALEKPVEAAEVNILGTIHALEAARKAGVERFLFASTVYVYSRAGGFYRCTKQACEAYIEEYERRFGLAYTILRYGSLYGPRADASNGVHRLLRQAATDGKVTVVGEPGDSREYIHVEDAARLSVSAAGEEHRNQHLVVTGAHPTRLADLLTMFSEILGRPLEIEYSEPAQGDVTGHYHVTPYSFSPRVGRKLTSSYYVDMGQGVLQMLEEYQRTEEEVL